MTATLQPEVMSRPGRLFMLECDVCGTRSTLRPDYRQLIEECRAAGWRVLPAASDRAVDGRFACAGCVPMFKRGLT